MHTSQSGAIGMKNTGAFAPRAVYAFAAICFLLLRILLVLFSLNLFGRVSDTPSAPHCGSPDCFDSPPELIRPETRTALSLSWQKLREQYDICKASQKPFVLRSYRAVSA